MIFLLWGPNDFGIQVALAKLLKENEGRVHHPKEITVEEFANLSLTDSFFDNKKNIILYSFLQKASKEKKDSEIIKILDKITADTTIVFVEKEQPKGALGKYMTGNARIQGFGKVTPRNLVDYVKERAKELGGEISPLAAERFVTFVGPNYLQIEEELKKLCLYAKDREIAPEIDINDVNELVSASFEANIFDLVDAISQKNTNRAISLLDSFLEYGVNELYILTMIARQFRNIAIAKLDEIQSEAALAKKAGLHPFVAKKTIYQAKKFTANEIGSVYYKIMKADLELKSGQNPKQVLQGIILN